MRVLALFAGAALTAATLLASADEVPAETSAEPAVPPTRITIEVPVHQAAPAAPVVTAPAASGRSLQQIAACMAANRQTHGAIRGIALDSVDREGNTKTVKVRAVWSPAAGGDGRLNLRVLEPQVLYGSSYLVLQKQPVDQVYLYLAFMNKVTALRPSEMTSPLWGTGVSFVELKQVQGLLLDGSVERRDDALIGERPVWVFDTTTDVDSTGLRHVISYIDQATCLLLKAESFSRSGEPAKVFEADVSTLSPAGPPWQLQRYTVQSLRDRSQTTITLDPVSVPAQIPESMFDPATFHQSPT